MAGSTKNLGLVTPELVDKVSETIPALANNFQKMDEKIGDTTKLPETIPDLATGLVNHDAQLADIVSVSMSEYPRSSGETDDTARINRAIDTLSSTGGVVQLANKSYTVSGQLHSYSNVLFKGASRGGTTINYSGSSFLFELTSVLNFGIENIKFEGLTTGNIVDFNNVFKNYIKNVQFDQCGTAIKFSNNAGDNNIANCLFTSNGVAISVQSQVNYVDRCVFSGNTLPIQIGTQNVSTTAGIRVTLTTFVTNSANVFPQYAIKDWGLTGVSVIDKCWFEGFLNTIEVGDGSNGAYGFTVKDSRVSATSKCINLVNGNRFAIENVTFQADNTANQPSPYTNVVPTELTVNSNCESGIISNPISLITGRTFNPTMTGLPKLGWVILNNRTNKSTFANGIDLNNTDLINVVNLIQSTSGSLTLGQTSKTTNGSIWYNSGTGTVNLYKGFTAALQTTLANADQDMNNQQILRVNNANYSKRVTAPVSPVQGMTAYADGSGWNPGNGEGLYIYKSTGWAFLG